MTNRFLSLSIILLLALGIASCCETPSKDSLPVVDYTSYRDTAIFVIMPGSLDSGYYPVYRFMVKNSGSERDVFTLRYRYPNGQGFDYARSVEGGESVLIQSPGPSQDSAARVGHYAIYLPFTPADTTLYGAFMHYGMLKHSPDQISIKQMRPEISISYGTVDAGPEGCGAPPVTRLIDIDQFEKK